MTLRVIVDKFVYKINPAFPWSLVLAAFVAYTIAARFSPGAYVEAGGGIAAAFMVFGLDRDTWENHSARFWKSYRKARGMDEKAKRGSRGR